MDIGGALTLSGSGTFIFRAVGALTSTAGASVSLSGGSACDVFWTPSGATTLAANTTFVGTDIDAAGITVGANTTWNGRALAFGGTVTTDTDTISVPSCSSASVPVVIPVVSTPVPATLHVIKTVVNNDGGVATASLFNLHVKLSGSDVAGSPAVGVVAPGTSYSLSAGTYTVSEDSNTSYTASFSGDCDSSGNVTLSEGSDKTCTVTNDDIAVVVAPVVEVAPVVIAPIVEAPLPVLVEVPVTVTTTPDAVAPEVVIPAVVAVPTLPNTGVAPAEHSATIPLVLTGVLGAMFFFIMRKNRTA